MSVEDFAACVSDRTSLDVRTLKRLTDDEWRALLGWWRGLSPETKALLAWLAAQNAGKFFAAVGAALAELGGTALEALSAMLAGVAMEVLIDSALACEGHLAG